MCVIVSRKKEKENGNGAGVSVRVQFGQVTVRIFILSFVSLLNPSLQSFLSFSVYYFSFRMTGEQDQISTNSEKPNLNDLDDLEPVGPGPVVVVTKSRKMSIYGPKFDCGPTQLRKQRLQEKVFLCFDVFGDYL